MTNASLEAYREKLLALGKHYTGEVKGLSGEAFRAVGGEASGILSNMPLHLADLASDNFEQEVALTLLENEEHTLEAITAALRRIEQGTFGRCEECRQEIARERLQALPYARLCFTCADKNQAEAR